MVVTGVSSTKLRLQAREQQDNNTDGYHLVRKSCDWGVIDEAPAATVSTRQQDVNAAISVSPTVPTGNPTAGTVQVM
jgi:hypothetical protein